jgi:hypothetical protein
VQRLTIFSSGQFAAVFRLYAFVSMFFIQHKNAVLLGFFAICPGMAQLFSKRSCADFFYAYVYPPCSKQNKPRKRVKIERDLFFEK